MGRHYGFIYTFPDGRRIYLADRMQKHYFRSGRPNISQAVREGVACWALDIETLDRVRVKGVRYVGVKKKDGDLYITCIDNFYNRDLSKNLDFTGVGQGGANQRYLPLQYFHKRIGSRWVRSELCEARETPVSSH